MLAPGLTRSESEAFPEGAPLERRRCPAAALHRSRAPAPSARSRDPSAREARALVSPHRPPGRALARRGHRYRSSPGARPERASRSAAGNGDDGDGRIGGSRRLPPGHRHGDAGLHRLDYEPGDRPDRAGELPGRAAGQATTRSSTSMRGRTRRRSFRRRGRSNATSTSSRRQKWISSDTAPRGRGTRSRDSSSKTRKRSSSKTWER